MLSGGPIQGLGSICFFCCLFVFILFIFFVYFFFDFSIWAYFGFVLFDLFLFCFLIFLLTEGAVGELPLLIQEAIDLPCVFLTERIITSVQTRKMFFFGFFSKLILRRFNPQFFLLISIFDFWNLNLILFFPPLPFLNPLRLSVVPKKMQPLGPMNEHHVTKASIHKGLLVFFFPTKTWLAESTWRVIPGLVSS